MKKTLLSIALGTILPFAGASANIMLQVSHLPSKPTVDGIPDAVWEGVPETLIPLAVIPQSVIDSNQSNQKGKYSKKWSGSKFTKTKTVGIKALYSGNEIFFLAKWHDETQDNQHKPWKWEGSKETGEYLAGKEREDRLAFMFPISGTFDPNKLSGREMVADVWQWKAARTNGASVIHDKSHIVSKIKPAGKSAAHYTSAGETIYVSRPGDGGVSPYKSNKIDPFTYQGDQIPKYIPIKPDHADAVDVSAKGVWANNSWTVEIGRKLDTGHKGTDTQFDPASNTSMAIAVFNHAGDHFHAVSDLVEVVFEQ